MAPQLEWISRGISYQLKNSWKNNVYIKLFWFRNFFRGRERWDLEAGTSYMDRQTDRLNLGCIILDFGHLFQLNTSPLRTSCSIPIFNKQLFTQKMRFFLTKYLSWNSITGFTLTWAGKMSPLRQASRSRNTLLVQQPSKSSSRQAPLRASWVKARTGWANRS